MFSTSEKLGIFNNCIGLKQNLHPLYHTVTNFII